MIMIIWLLSGLLVDLTLSHDHRMYGDVDVDNDTVVFSHRADPDCVSQFTDQDHERH
jgi:hypothetical protein